MMDAVWYADKAVDPYMVTSAVIGWKKINRTIFPTIMTIINLKIKYYSRRVAREIG
jgi:hypothetical protein